MKVVFDYAQGLISHEEFEAEQYLNPEIWAFLQSLIPDDISDKNCEFRKNFPRMEALETNNYNIKATLTAFGYNAHIVHTTICFLLRFKYPELVCKAPEEDDFLIKNKIGFIGGNEADTLINELLLKCSNLSNRDKKAIILKAFHISNSKHPRWVQEPEWPFSNNHPMRFCFQKHFGDLYKYYFEDVDTGEIKIIEQLV